MSLPTQPTTNNTNSLFKSKGNYIENSLAPSIAAASENDDSPLGTTLHVLCTFSLPITYLSLVVTKSLNPLSFLQQFLFGSISQSAFLFVYYLYGKYAGWRYFYEYVYVSPVKLKEDMKRLEKKKAGASKGRKFFFWKSKEKSNTASEKK